MKQVLHALHHHRRSFDVHDSLDPQHVGPAQGGEQFQGGRKGVPGERRVKA